MGLSTRTVKDESLDSQLQYLESILNLDGEETLVCILCWSVWADATCTCNTPIWWPINHALSKLQALVWI